MSDGAGGHANRTKQIGRVTVVMTRALPVVRCNGSYLRGEAMLEALAGNGMNVTKRQTDIDGERKERQPRTTPGMVTKPAHYGPSQFSSDFASAAILEHDPEKWKPVFRKDHAQTKR
jgi:hypothetical protein